MAIVDPLSGTFYLELEGRKKRVNSIVQSISEKSEVRLLNKSGPFWRRHQALLYSGEEFYFGEHALECNLLYNEPEHKKQRWLSHAKAPVVMRASTDSKLANVISTLRGTNIHFEEGTTESYATHEQLVHMTTYAGMPISTKTYTAENPSWYSIKGTLFSHKPLELMQFMKDHDNWNFIWKYVALCNHDGERVAAVHSHQL